MGLKEGPGRFVGWHGWYGVVGKGDWKRGVAGG